MDTNIRSESYRVEMKKFGEAKAPLNMLKFKMQLKADKNEAFKVFYDELEKATLEQNKFLENLEYQVALSFLFELRSFLRSFSHRSFHLQLRM